MDKLKIKTQNVHYDESADAMYIRLRSGTEARIEEIEPNIIVEYDSHNNPIGIEILSFSSSVLSKIPHSSIIAHDQNLSYRPSTQKDRTKKNL